MNVGKSDLAHYEKDGFLIVENLVSPDEIKALQDRLRDYTHGERDRGMAIFQTEPSVEQGEITVEHPGDGIRKIGKLVQHDALYRKLGSHPNILGVIETILGPDIKLFRNDILVKPPGVGSAKSMHQDSPYWPIEPMSLCSCWFAIDDATVENGCMGVLPGAHKLGPLAHTNVTGELTIEEACYDLDDIIMAPMKAGSGLFFHSLLPHYTAPNISDTWRRAIALSYMSSKHRYNGEGEGPEYFHIQGETFPGCVR
ncbi:MAG: phytanoyl-CoA dioxygenase family protein [Lentisphaeria bacterium]|nr:phytanoyl-CoA dioxygenase family protein [Lentisphaeria bacterium]NQZ68386.1 phytanoyl-CoA dioxygenase family protein [Lentisphaeria bacterium]